MGKLWFFFEVILKLLEVSTSQSLCFVVKNRAILGEWGIFESKMFITYVLAVGLKVQESAKIAQLRFCWTFLVTSAKYV